MTICCLQLEIEEKSLRISRFNKLLPKILSLIKSQKETKNYNDKKRDRDMQTRTVE